MKKKTITICCCTTAGILLLLGIVIFAVRSTSHKKVTVVPVQELVGYGGGMENMNLSGFITSDVSQEVRPTSDQVVEEIYVKEGDTVKVGDKLLSYDMTLVNLEMEMKKLDKDGIELDIKKAERELEKLRNTKPAQDNPDIPDIPDVPDTPPKAEPALAVLDENALPYAGEGTSQAPYQFLVSQTGTIKGAFLNRMALEQKFFVVEVREGDQSTGKLIKFWGQTVSAENFKADPEAQYDLELEMREKREEEKEIPAFETLKAENAEEYLKGDGTREKPYVFLVKADGTVEGSFFKLMKEQKAFFRIEVRGEDKNDGILVKAWEQNGELLADVLPDEIFFARLEKKAEEPEKPEQPQKPEDPEKPEDTQKPEDPENPKNPEKPEDPKTPGAPQNPHNSAVSMNFTGEGKIVVRHLNAGSLDNVMGADSFGLTQEEINQQIKQKEQEIRDYRLNLREAELEWQSMERELGNQTVTSTLNGVVKTVGDPKEPSLDGSPLIYVAGSEGLYVTGQVSEMQLNAVKPGTNLTGFAYEDGINFTAQVQEVSPYPIENNDYYGGGGPASMYPFTAYIQEAEGLTNNSWVDLSAENSENISDNVMQLEKAFVRSENGKYYVMIDNGKGKLKKQYVNVTRVVWGYQYEINSGLSMNDKIAFPYGKDVKEGAKTEDGTVESLYQ